MTEVATETVSLQFTNDAHFRPIIAGAAAPAAVAEAAAARQAAAGGKKSDRSSNNQLEEWEKWEE